MLLSMRTDDLQKNGARVPGSQRDVRSYSAIQAAQRVAKTKLNAIGEPSQARVTKRSHR